MARQSLGRAEESLYNKTIMRNGVRVITEQFPAMRSISLGIWIDVGSRCEAPEEGGLAHFLEHLVFKGTRGRNAAQIAGSLESIGGALNAFTTREQTCFTARILDEHLVAAVEVLADLTCRATLTRTNMDRERQVICEEIKESLDNPADRIHDLFAATHWADQALGRPIMGNEKTVRQVTRAQLRGFQRNHYRANSIVIAAAGSISHKQLLNLVRQKFEFEPGQAGLGEPATSPGGVRIKVEPDDSSQTHYCLGFPGVAYGDRERTPLSLLAAHLGGGMSSVLFQKVREQRGLAYSVFAFNDFFRDVGLFGVYLGTDHTHLEEAHDLVIAECRRAKKTKLTSTTLDKVKAQIKGHLTLGMESMSGRMHRLGRQELLSGSRQSLADTIDQIEKVTPGELREAANLVMDESRLTITTLGPTPAGLFDNLASP